jgi:hypothetical protein
MPEDELVYDIEDEESQLLEKLRNLHKTPSDDGCVRKTVREAKYL